MDVACYATLEPCCAASRAMFCSSRAVQQRPITGPLQRSMRKRTNERKNEKKRRGKERGESHHGRRPLFSLSPLVVLWRSRAELTGDISRCSLHGNNSCTVGEKEMDKRSSQQHCVIGSFTCKPCGRSSTPLPTNRFYQPATNKRENSIEITVKMTPEFKSGLVSIFNYRSLTVTIFFFLSFDR